MKKTCSPLKTPFFPQFRARLAPLGQRVEKLRQKSLSHLDTIFSPFIPPEYLSQADEGENSRERVFTIRRTFFGFLYQVLKPETSCREVLRQIQALLGLHDGGTIDDNSSAYCQARRRLPLESLERIRSHLATTAENAASLWYGLSPKVIDGTTTTAPDTAANQLAYPQSRAQKPGCGFPLIKLVAIFSLSTGALLQYVKGNKHQNELRLLQGLLDYLKPSDVVVADRGFSSYVLLVLLYLRGIQALFRLHGSRKADFRKGKRLGKNDRLILWQRPFEKPLWLPQCVWKHLPRVLLVRIIRFKLPRRGFRTTSVTLVTTLLDPKIYPAGDIAQLYARRWKIELWFRDIKTSMKMEKLSCKSPDMLHRELEMYFIAYNLIRSLMRLAAATHEAPLDRLSFKGTVDSLRQFSLAIAQARSKKRQSEIFDLFLLTIAKDIVPDRPNRREPRAVKRRPKPYSLLTKPRHLFKEIPHRSHYRKKEPSKNGCLI